MSLTLVSQYSDCGYLLFGCGHTQLWEAGNSSQASLHFPEISWLPLYFVPPTLESLDTAGFVSTGCPLNARHMHRPRCHLAMHLVLQKCDLVSNFTQDKVGELASLGPSPEL